MLKKHSLNYWGEFKDKEREKKYFQEEIVQSLSYIKPLVLILGSLYFLFIIPDYFLIRNPFTFRLILANRVLLFGFVLVLYHKLPKLVDDNTYCYWITLYKFLFSCSFLIIYALYESPSFLIQSWGVILIMLAVYLIPNRWIYTVSVSIVLYWGFFLLSIFVIPVIELWEFLASCVYLLVILVFSGVTTWRLNYYKRIQYLYNRRMSFYSTRDSLTRLYNRFKFEHELQKVIYLARRYHQPFSLIFYDIDDFKRINDQYGHLMGDVVLATQAQLISQNIRECDIYARWGGEEFIIVLPNTVLEGALDVTRKIKRLIAEYPFEVGSITCSFGVTSFTELDDKHSLIHRVDSLLYRAKQAGKNRIVSDKDYNESN